MFRAGILRKPPFLCIELLSFGVEYIWMVDPRERKGWSYTREGKRESTRVLTTSEPCLTLSLKEIFEELGEAVG